MHMGMVGEYLGEGIIPSSRPARGGDSSSVSREGDPRADNTLRRACYKWSHQYIDVGRTLLIHHILSHHSRVGLI